jgi:hypothetical protein
LALLLQLKGTVYVLPLTFYGLCLLYSSSPCLLCFSFGRSAAPGRGARRSLFRTPSKDNEQPIVENALPVEEVPEVGFADLEFDLNSCSSIGPVLICSDC